MKISVYHKDGIAACEQHFKERFGGLVTVVTSGYKWLDMIGKGVNKGRALELLMKQLQIKPEEVLVFGDHYNDVEMIETAGFSCAMRSGQQEIVKKCTMSADTVEEVLKRLVEGETL